MSLSGQGVVRPPFWCLKTRIRPPSSCTRLGCIGWHSLRSSTKPDKYLCVLIIVNRSCIYSYFLAEFLGFVGFLSILVALPIETEKRCRIWVECIEDVYCVSRMRVVRMSMFPHRGFRVYTFPVVLLTRDASHATGRVQYFCPPTSQFFVPEALLIASCLSALSHAIHTPENKLWIVQVVCQHSHIYHLSSQLSDMPYFFPAHSMRLGTRFSATTIFAACSSLLPLAFKYQSNETHCNLVEQPNCTLLSPTSLFSFISSYYSTSLQKSSTFYWKVYRSFISQLSQLLPNVLLLQVYYHLCTWMLSLESLFASLLPTNES